jgi:capsular polysaccharide biosynthesis protein
VDLVQLLRIVGRWWWLVALPPILAATIGFWVTNDPPYQSEVRATVLIPGDTEIPGNAERPELMVLDDAPVFVRSHAFAELVAIQLAAAGGAELPVSDVQDSLSGERYSRVLTIRATRDDGAEAKAIAAAAESVLPNAVNQYLVADGADPATVRIIDPASEPARANEHRWLILAVETFVALMVGVGFAVLVESLTKSEPEVENV